MRRDAQTIIGGWIEEDPIRWRALRVVAQFKLPDWCLAAGFVRNLVWDRLHDFATTTPLDDIDLIYFDATDVTAQKDRQIELMLRQQINLPWSVKNQARMHQRNGHKPYASTQHAMTYWTEVETAVGVTLNSDQQLDIIAPFGLEAIMSKTITYNPKSSYQGFLQRLKKKSWLGTWPELSIKYP